MERAQETDYHQGADQNIPVWLIKTTFLGGGGFPGGPGVPASTARGLGSLLGFGIKIPHAQEKTLHMDITRCPTLKSD